MKNNHLYNIVVTICLAVFYFSALKYLLPNTSIMEEWGLAILFIFTIVLGALLYFLLRGGVLIKLVAITLIVVIVLLLLEGGGDPAKPTIHFVGIVMVVPFGWIGIGISSSFRVMSNYILVLVKNRRGR